MPLLPGKENISRNISELTHHGSRERSHRQIVAIALANADRHPHKAGGGGIGFAGGGFAKPPAFHLMPPVHALAPVPKPESPSMGTPSWTRSTMRMDSPAHMRFARGGIGEYVEFGGHEHMAGGGDDGAVAGPVIPDEAMHSGLIGGVGGGRTDRTPLSVPSGAHVVPADAVSGLGQGASHNGAALWAAAIRGGPWGVPVPATHGGHGPPSAPHAAAQQTQTMAEGGEARTSILAASGEVVVAPEDVEAIGERAIRDGRAKRGESAADVGHRLIDEAIDRVRKFNISWLRAAPPPKK